MPIADAPASSISTASSPVVTPPVRQAHHPQHHLVAHLEGNLDTGTAPDVVEFERPENADDRASLDQESIDLQPCLVPGKPIGEECNDGNRQPDSQGYERGESGSKAHCSRATYPTPRTVWINRGSASTWVLRLR